jgi:hypothetical protein
MRGMRKTLLSIAVIGPFVVLSGFVGPASAEPGEQSCVSRPAADAGPIDLDTIPAKPVAGPQSIQGGGIDDECDDVAAVGKATGDDVRAALRKSDDHHQGEGVGEDD